MQDTIQAKLIKERRFPKLAEVAGVINKLSDEDTLYRLLAHWHSDMNFGCIGKEAQLKLAKESSVLSSKFLLWSICMRDSRHAAQKCSICGQRDLDKVCKATDHSKEDVTEPHVRSAISYHSVTC